MVLDVWMLETSCDCYRSSFALILTLIIFSHSGFTVENISCTLRPYYKRHVAFPSKEKNIVMSIEALEKVIEVNDFVGGPLKYNILDNRSDKFQKYFKISCFKSSFSCVICTLSVHLSCLF